MIKNVISAIALILPILFSTIGVAADFDGSKPLICIATEVADCSVFDGCQRASPQSVNLPRFLRIDLPNKEIKGDSRKTAIQNVHEEKGLIILQGVQADRAWSVLLSTQTGDITGTVTGDGFGFVVYGACTTFESLGS